MNIVFDIGGTNTRIAAVKEGADAFEKPRIFHTPEKFEEAMTLFGSVARELSGGTIERAVGGAAGPMTKGKTRLLQSHLSDWIGKPLREGLATAFGAPVRLENDSALVGLGEARYGAGRTFPIVVYITVSTGVGGARIVDGAIDRNSFGFEPGHQIVCAAGGAKCSTCGVNGHLEAYVSGKAFRKNYLREPNEITDPLVWEEAAVWLAYGVHNAVVHWSPDVIVLGGKMITAPHQIDVERVREHLKETLTFFDGMPEVRKAELGDFGGLYGGMALLKERS